MDYMKVVIKLLGTVLVSVLLALIVSVKVKAQDTVRLVHLNYTSVYSKSLHYPILVEWWETKAKVNCANPLPRKDQFQPDPLLPAETNLQKDYTKSGLDRGHLAPAASNLCQGPKVLTECFYFSNIVPQYHALNGGDWKLLEVLTRNLASKNDSVHVWAGSIGEVKKIGTTSVPAKCWKVVHVLATGEKVGYLFDNNTSKSTGIEDNKVNISIIEKLTGLKFGE